MSDPAKSASSVLSITSIVLSMAGVGIGNGMMFAYVPFMLAKSGSSPEVAGAAVTALAFGGLAGLRRCRADDPSCRSCAGLFLLHGAGHPSRRC